MRSRHFALAGDISSLSRYVATPPDVVLGASTPSEKIYSFLLNDLAKASANNYSHGQTIASQAPDGLTAEGSCWEEKSIHEAIPRRLKIEGRRWKIAPVPHEASLYLRSSILDPLRLPSWVNHQSIHS